MSNRILLLKTPDGIGIDVSLGAIPYEEKAIERAKEVEFLPGVCLRICSAEDLIVLKAFADRSQDWADVESVIQKRRWERATHKKVDELDWTYIEHELRELCAVKDPRIVSKLDDVRNRNQ